ncbi:MAG: matrixin family metalloprotease [Gammaproteobacteria bacterium]|jgi:hypothetical protein
MNLLAHNEKLFLQLTIAVGMIGILHTPLAQAERPFTLPANAKQIAKDIYDLGTGMHNGEHVRGIAFIHRQDRTAKPQGVGGGNKDKGGSTCYAFISSGAKWKSVEDYIIDSANLSGMSQSDVEGTIADATRLWNDQASGRIFGSQVAGTVDGAETQTPLDDKNEIYFADINDAAIGSNNTIAVTVTWGVFSGPPRARKLVEWDQVYNQSFTFGDASINTGIMDFLGIAAHEIGHAAGMDHPDSTCTEETMYAYAANGETKKRNLNEGDIVGIKKLYK